MYGYCWLNTQAYQLGYNKPKEKDVKGKKKTNLACYWDFLTIIQQCNMRTRTCIQDAWLWVWHAAASPGEKSDMAVIGKVYILGSHLMRDRINSLSEASQQDEVFLPMITLLASQFEVYCLGTGGSVG